MGKLKQIVRDFMFTYHKRDNYRLVGRKNIQVTNVNDALCLIFRKITLIIVRFADFLKIPSVELRVQTATEPATETFTTPKQKKKTVAPDDFFRGGY